MGPLAMALSQGALQPDTYEGQMIDLTNRDRTANGLGNVSWDDALLSIARQRAADQRPDQPLNHYDPAGQLVFLRMLQNAGLFDHTSGENLARAHPIDVSAIQSALMASPLHRANILNPSFSRMAIGMTYDGDPHQGGTLAEIFR